MTHSVISGVFPFWNKGVSEAMIICSCNVFSDRDVRDCLDGPSRPERPRDVYAALGCAPKCGRCAETIASIMSEAKARGGCDAAACCCAGADEMEAAA